MKSVRNVRGDQTTITFKKNETRNEGSNHDRNSHYLIDKRRNSNKYATQNNKTANTGNIITFEFLLLWKIILF